jgi:transposase InsO family protein
MALEGGHKPEIIHSDQGCQFTPSDFVARLQAEKIKISWLGTTEKAKSIAAQLDSGIEIR